MFDELMNLVRGESQQAIVNNPDVPNEQNEAVTQEAGNSIFSSLQGMLQQGGPGALKDLFQGVQSGDPNHPAVQQVADNVSGGLMQKFGLNSGAAKALAISLVPVVLSKLINHAQNNTSPSGTGGGFNIGNILGSLMGGSNSGPGSLGSMFGNGSNAQQPQTQTASNPSGGSTLDGIGNMLGLDKNGDGHTDLKDLMSMFGH